MQGASQSPIDINECLLRRNPWAENLKINFDKEDGLVTGSLVNDGSTPILKVNKTCRPATLTGGPVGEKVYLLEQFHFHFGCACDKGSEHTFGGKSYPVEVFIIYCFTVSR